MSKTRCDSVTIRLLEGDKERLDALTKLYALNGAALLRMLLKREADAVLSQSTQPQSP